VGRQRDGINDIPSRGGASQTRSRVAVAGGFRGRMEQCPICRVPGGNSMLSRAATSNRLPWLLGIVIAAGAGAAVVSHFRAAPTGEQPSAGSAPSAAVAALEREAETRQGDPEALLAIGERLRRAGETQRAFEVIARAYEPRFKDPQFGAAMAEALLFTGQVGDAESLSAALVAKHAASADVRAVRADVLLKDGRYSEGLVQARKAVALDAKSPRAARAFARASALEQRLEEAWPAFERAVALSPGDTALLADYGHALSRYGRRAEGEKRLRAAALLAPRDPRILVLLGTHLGQEPAAPAAWKEGQSILEQAVSLAPTATEPRYQLGRLLLQTGDAGSAVEQLEEVLRLDPSLGDARLPLAQSYQALGRADAAREAFRHYRRYSDYRRDAAHLERRLRRSPRSLSLLLRMGGLHESQGFREQAARYYRQALRLRPDPELQAHLGGLER
jgi:Tfp pilus assembly protein PilF